MDLLRGEEGDRESWGWEEQQGGAQPLMVAHQVKDLDTGLKRFAGSLYNAQAEWFPFFWQHEPE